MVIARRVLEQLATIGAHEFFGAVGGKRVVQDVGTRIRADVAQDDFDCREFDVLRVGPFAFVDQRAVFERAQMVDEDGIAGQHDHAAQDLHPFFRGDRNGGGRGVGRRLDVDREGFAILGVGDLVGQVARIDEKLETDLSGASVEDQHARCAQHGRWAGSGFVDRDDERRLDRALDEFFGRIGWVAFPEELLDASADIFGLTLGDGERHYVSLRRRKGGSSFGG